MVLSDILKAERTVFLFYFKEVGAYNNHSALKHQVGWRVLC